MEFNNFEEIKQYIKDHCPCCNKNILLGNGFTRACAGTVGREDKLNSGEIIKNVHDKINIKIKNINSVETYMYEIEKTIIKEIYTSLPQEEINEIIGKNEITNFLNYFENYYTLNYDYILYRLLLKLNDKNPLRTTDGFNKIQDGDKDLIWDKKNKQNTYYLHGAFHFISKENLDLKKVSCNTGNFPSEIEKEWDEGRKSHVIISPNSKRKEIEIKNSNYLSYCFDSFSNMPGILVTMGVSFGESDKHIVDAIIYNDNLKNVYLGWQKEDDRSRINDIFPTDNDNKYHLYPTKDIFKPTQPTN